MEYFLYSDYAIFNCFQISLYHSVKFTLFIIQIPLQNQNFLTLPADVFLVYFHSMDACLSFISSKNSIYSTCTNILLMSHYSPIYGLARIPPNVVQSQLSIQNKLAVLIRLRTSSRLEFCSRQFILLTWCTLTQLLKVE